MEEEQQEFEESEDVIGTGDGNEDDNVNDLEEDATGDDDIAGGDDLGGAQGGGEEAV